MRRESAVKILIPLLLTIASSVASSQAMASDSLQTALNEVCKASLISESAAKRTAREFGITRSQRERLMCNEQTLVEFAQSYSTGINELNSMPATAAGNEAKIVNIQ